MAMIGLIVQAVFQLKTAQYGVPFDVTRVKIDLSNYFTAKYIRKLIDRGL